MDNCKNINATIIIVIINNCANAIYFANMQLSIATIETISPLNNELFNDLEISRQANMAMVHVVMIDINIENNIIFYFYF